MNEQIRNRVYMNTCRSAVDEFGEEYMLNVCMEEPAELVQAISKYRRYGTSWKGNVAEEIADVYITLTETAMLCGIPDDEIEDWIDKKQMRTRERIKEREHDDNKGIAGENK